MADSDSRLYPAFGAHPPRFGRVQRLETGRQRYQGGVLRPTSGTYTGLPKNILHPKLGGTQVLDISKVFIRKVGGVSVSGNTSPFTYSATTTTVTLYWDGSNGSTPPVIIRADGSRFTVPTSGSPLTVSGLLANTTYYFLPFWNINSLCNIGWVAGTTGTPQVAFVVADTTDQINGPAYLMQQTLQANEPLTNGYMTAVTPASGSTGPIAPGGGGEHGKGCVMSGTDIQTLGDLPYQIEVMGESEWIHLRIEDGRELYCTYNHPLYDAVEGKTRADMLRLGNLVITDRGEQRLVMVEPHRRACSKHKVIMPKGHLFWANGFLSHNTKAQF